MASDVAEQADLAPTQREALDQYIQVTAQDIKDAIPLLQRSEWNVQVEYLKYLAGYESRQLKLVTFPKLTRLLPS